MYSLKSTDERNNAIDILKILSMVMVVLLHLRQYGIYKAEVELHTPIYWMALLVRSFSVVAVNCFVLISGYFLCDQVVKKKTIESVDSGGDVLRRYISGFVHYSQSRSSF